MCGIAGIVTSSGKPSPRSLQKITDTLSYRGPDDKGYRICGRAGLGNRRLKVMDLSTAGHIPMWDQTGAVGVTYNGEVYNFNQLKSRLLRLGVKFRSNSDTEVILNQYLKFGVTGLKRLRGMFAFAIWDNRSEELLLFRDHFGIKPLFYSFVGDDFVFGSELKVILSYPKFKRRLSNYGLGEYFSLGFGCTSNEGTIYQDIYKLPAGHYAILKKGKLSVFRYWDFPASSSNHLTFRQAQAQLGKLLEKSVVEQLVADVKVGSFLSGGLDSSLITALAAKNSKTRLNTFSVGFDVPEYDESKYSDKVSQFLQTDHHHIEFKIDKSQEILDEVTENLDEPTGDSSLLSTYLLAKETGKTVTVALAGDGGDELFLGYPTYLAHKLAAPFNYLPKTLVGVCQNLAMWSPQALELLSFVNHISSYSTRFKLEKFFGSLSHNSTEQHLNFLSVFSFDDKMKLFGKRQKDYEIEQTLKKTSELLEPYGSISDLKKAQLIDLKILLTEGFLQKTDRASSYNSLEVRVPFLNVELAELSLSLPTTFHLKGLRLKNLLKETARGILPEEIINRPKKGFGVPIKQMLVGPLHKELKKLTGKSYLKKQGLFDASYIADLLQYFSADNEISTRQVWQIFMFQKWWDRWMR
jgi:asparagine synthase (glutamine-hydrolysing)